MLEAEHFEFKYPAWTERGREWVDTTDAKDWFERWAVTGDAGSDNPCYFNLIDKDGLFEKKDIETIGKWKEGCLAEGDRWKDATPVAWQVWKEAEQQPIAYSGYPKQFLDFWQGRRFVAGYFKSERNGHRIGEQFKQSFGLSRATTLLHFLSKGEYPILDTRTREAIRRLGHSFGDTTEAYLNDYCRLWNDLAKQCGIRTSDLRAKRKLDNALFNCGAYPIYAFEKRAGIAPRDKRERIAGGSVENPCQAANS